MILVVGAGGKVGRHVVAGLAGAGAKVRALVHADALPDGPFDVELLRGDLRSGPSLEQAVAGVDAVFLVWPLDDADLAPAIMSILARPGLRIVYLSTVGVNDALEFQPHPLSEMHSLVERALKRGGANWTVLRATKFATNTLAWADSIRSHGIVEGAFGDARRSPVHQRDVAAVAVRVLLEGDGRHSARTYVVSGPEALSERQQVAILGEVLQRSLSWHEIQPEEARRRMLADGASAELADAALAYWARFVDEPEPVTEVVAQLTGRPARSYREWATEHASLFS